MIWYDILSFFLIKWWWIIFVIIVISPYIDWIGIKFVVVVVFSLSLEYERPIDERNETKRTNETDFSNIYLRIFSIWFFVFFRSSLLLFHEILLFLCIYVVVVFRYSYSYSFRFLFPLVIVAGISSSFFSHLLFLLFSNIIVVQIWVLLFFDPIANNNNNNKKLIRSFINLTSGSNQDQIGSDRDIYSFFLSLKCFMLCWSNWFDIRSIISFRRISRVWLFHFFLFVANK